MQCSMLKTGSGVGATVRPAAILLSSPLVPLRNYAKTAAAPAAPAGGGKGGGKGGKGAVKEESRRAKRLASFKTIREENMRIIDLKKKKFDSFVKRQKYSGLKEELDAREAAVEAAELSRKQRKPKKKDVGDISGKVETYWENELENFHLENAENLRPGLSLESKTRAWKLHKSDPHYWTPIRLGHLFDCDVSHMRCLLWEGKMTEEAEEAGDYLPSGIVPTIPYTISRVNRRKIEKGELVVGFGLLSGEPKVIDPAKEMILYAEFFLGNFMQEFRAALKKKHPDLYKIYEKRAKNQRNFVQEDNLEVEVEQEKEKEKEKGPEDNKEDILSKKAAGKGRKEEASEGKEEQQEQQEQQEEEEGEEDYSISITDDTGTDALARFTFEYIKENYHTPMIQKLMKNMIYPVPESIPFQSYDEISEVVNLLQNFKGTPEEIEKLTSIIQLDKEGKYASGEKREKILGLLKNMAKEPPAVGEEGDSKKDIYLVFRSNLEEDFGIAGDELDKGWEEAFGVRDFKGDFKGTPIRNRWITKRNNTWYYLPSGVRSKELLQFLRRRDSKTYLESPRIPPRPIDPPKLLKELVGSGVKPKGTLKPGNKSKWTLVDSSACWNMYNRPIYIRDTDNTWRTPTWDERREVHDRNRVVFYPWRHRSEDMILYPDEELADKLAIQHTAPPTFIPEAVNVHPLDFATTEVYLQKEANRRAHIIQRSATRHNFFTLMQPRQAPEIDIHVPV